MWYKKKHKNTQRSGYKTCNMNDFNWHVVAPRQSIKHYNQECCANHNKRKKKKWGKKTDDLIPISHKTTRHPKLPLFATSGWEILEKCRILQYKLVSLWPILTSLQLFWVLNSCTTLDKERCCTSMKRILSRVCLYR